MTSVSPEFSEFSVTSEFSVSTVFAVASVESSDITFDVSKFCDERTTFLTLSFTKPFISPKQKSNKNTTAPTIITIAITATVLLISCF